MATKKKTKRIDEQFVKTFAAEAQKMAGRTALRKLSPKKRTWKPTIGAKFGPQEQKLRAALTVHKSADVAFLFRAIIGPLGVCGGRLTTPRMMHQRIGAIAARHNRKVKSPHIVAGDQPGTYRLKRIR